MATVKVPLTEQEEAHLALILEIHSAATRELQERQQQANQVKAQRVGPITRAHGIPESTVVNVIARDNGAPAFLVYEVPDIVPADTASVSPQASEKSTDALASTGA